MNLSTLLRDLATLYRRYGDIPVVIETPDLIYAIQRVDDDIWNIDNDVSVVIETEQVDNPAPDIPTREKTRDIQARIKPRTSAEPSAKSRNGRTRSTT